MLTSLPWWPIHSLTPSWSPVLHTLGLHLQAYKAYWAPTPTVVGTGLIADEWGKTAQATRPTRTMTTSQGDMSPQLGLGPVFLQLRGVLDDFQQNAV